MMLHIPATHEESAFMVREARHICGHCGIVVLTSDTYVTANLARHVCDGDFEWLDDAGDSD